MGLHDVEPHSSTVSSIGKDLTRKANRVIATEFVLYSKNQYQLFQTRFPRYKANFVGMSVKDFGEKIPSTHFQDDIRKLLFFGGLQPYKGVDLLIQAFECLIDEGVINLRLSINGRFSSEEYKKQCLSLIHHKEYYDLHLAFVDNKDVPELFSKNDVAVFPYRDATQSGPLMINLNYGLPIISPNHTCFADIYTDKKNAFFYADSFDYHSLKEALRRVSLISKEEYDVMLRECDALRCGYTEEAIVQNYISVFNRVMQEHPRKR
jgi:glycosyltransferase involved in cell wall biosynthesis